MKNETLLKKFEDAVIKLWNDEQAEWADPNRENAGWAREQCRKLRVKVLERMDKCASLRAEVERLQEVNAELRAKTVEAAGVDLIERLNTENDRLRGLLVACAERLEEHAERKRARCGHGPPIDAHLASSVRKKLERGE
jgi:FtsZ-binding cell division protein ZapB